MSKVIEVFSTLVLIALMSLIPNSSPIKRMEGSSSNQPDPATGLTPREKSLVAASWALATEDITGTGVQLLLMFFKRKPEYKNYFPFKNIPDDELPNNAPLKAHAARVMYALSSIVDNLDNADVLIELLKNTGTSHIRRKIPEESFRILKEVVLDLLKKSLGPKITEEGLCAWDKTLTVAMKVIVDAYTAKETA